MTSNSTSVPIEAEQSDTNPNKPFANDWLLDEGSNQPTRLAIAQNLGYLARGANEPFRLMLNGGWGTGKTWFIHNMVKLFEQDDHLAVVHINAWELDFTDDPFIAFASKLVEDVGFDDESESLVSKIATGLLKMPSISYQPTPDSPSASVSLGPLIDELKGDVGKALFQKHRTMMECRMELQKAITKQFGPGSPKRLVFVIDELDRCEPRFAITLMERIKHFFETEGVVVIAAVDKSELCNTIRGAFGENFDAIRYLQRFYDVEYELPKGNISNYATLCLRNTFSLELESGILSEGDLQRHGNVFAVACSRMRQNASELRLREISQLSTKIRIVYLSVGHPGSYTAILSILIACIHQTQISGSLQSMLNDEGVSPTEVIQQALQHTGLTNEQDCRSVLLALVIDQLRSNIYGDMNHVLQNLKKDAPGFPYNELKPHKFARALYFAEGFNMINETSGEESS